MYQHNILTDTPYMLIEHNIIVCNRFMEYMLLYNIVIYW